MPMELLLPCTFSFRKKIMQFKIPDFCLIQISESCLIFYLHSLSLRLGLGIGLGIRLRIGLGLGLRLGRKWYSKLHNCQLFCGDYNLLVILSIN